VINQFSRTELIIDADGIQKLRNSKVAVFGIGGVGSFAVEALIRAGIGNLVLVDNDEVCLTNINRQLIATHKTIGKPKVEVAKERCLEINPNANIIIHKKFYLEGSSDILTDDIDYIVDAIDTVTGKIGLIEEANRLGIGIVSSMGTGNKIHPEFLEIEDIYKTSVCPLAKVMRYELKKRGIKKLKVVYSKENPIKPKVSDETSNKRVVPGSISFVPPVAGMILAGIVIRDLLNLK